MADLVMQEAHHVHAADNVVLILTVTVQESYHDIVCACDISPSWHGTTLFDDGKTHPHLPDLRIEAQAGERIDADAELPGVQLTDMRGGARMDDTPNLPDLELSAAALVGATASLDQRLPAMEASGRTGARADDELMLPAMELGISIWGDLLARLDRTLPGLTISAQASTPVVATLAKDLPPLSISAAASAITTASLNRDLPALKISAQALIGATGTLDATLPDLELDSDSGLYGDALSLDATLPAVVMASIATGTFGGQAGELVDSSRFTDYVMRYER